MCVSERRGVKGRREKMSGSIELVVGRSVCVLGSLGS
jgi:hypothetical protein